MPLSSHIKPEPNPPLTRERAIRAREMYAEGFTVSRILAHCQMALGTLYACLDGVPFGADGERMASMPRRREVTGQRRRALKTNNVSLVNRLLRTAERQVRDIETRLAARDHPPVERERDVRILTSLTRALRDLQALRKVQDTGPEAPRRSIEELRASVAAKLAAVIAERQGGRNGDETGSAGS